MSPGALGHDGLTPLVRSMLESAREVRMRAYAPYSGYAVGAAVLDEHGRIWPGCNVENVSYGLCVCAERNALARLVGEGSKMVLALMLLTEDGSPPCGACLQCIAEFASDPRAVLIHRSNGVGEIESSRLSDLLPTTFNSASVSRTSEG